MAGRDVIVVGAITIDFTVVTVKLPGPGETVVGGNLAMHGGGKGANAAVAAARAGARTHLIGAVGDDTHGVAALAELRAEGVEVTAVAVHAGAATGVALIMVDANGENQIAVGAGANFALTPAHVLAAMQRLLPTAGCVLVSTEIPGEAVAAAVSAAADAGLPCILNPAPVIPVVRELLARGPILTPNASELQALHPGTSGQPTNPSVTELATQLVAESGNWVVVTLGGDGVLAAAPDGGVERLPAIRIKVVDTTGAGDTFNGVLAAALAEGSQFLDAVGAANLAAARSVSAAGARGDRPGN